MSIALNAFPRNSGLDSRGSRDPLVFNEGEFGGSVKGKTVLVTGGASGLGEGMARRFASLGCGVMSCGPCGECVDAKVVRRDGFSATVIVGDINASRGVELVADMRRETGNEDIHYHDLDVTSWRSQCSYFRAALSLSPTRSINVVIANAGVGELGGFTEPDITSSLEDPPEPDLITLDVNLKGVLYTTKLAFHYFRQTPADQDKTLLFIGSMSSFFAGPVATVYSASKHGVLGLFRSLRLFPGERDGVRVNLVCPYFVDTPLLPNIAKLLLVGAELAKVEDVVSAAEKCVCDEEVSGRCLVVAPRGSGGVMEVGADEMEEIEVFSRRVVRAINMQHEMQSWGKWIGDVCKILCLEPLAKVFGR
ncbi:hypothetical protein RUND412_000821 [Rhizina undulata]